MVEMTPQRWQQTNQYLQEVFGKEDAAIAQITQEARAAGLPDIAIDAVVGRLLMILTSMTRGKLAIEIGTLAGYSATWITRGLHENGNIEIRLGDAAQVLQDLSNELEPQSVDLAFLDADKPQYPENWKVLRPLISIGGLVVIDNALGSSQCWIGDNHPSRHAADAACRMIADDPHFQSVAIPLRQGVLIGRRMKA